MFKNPLLRFAFSITLGITVLIALMFLTGFIAGIFLDISVLDFFRLAGNLNSAQGVAVNKLLLIVQTIALFGIVPFLLIYSFKKQQTIAFIQIGNSNYKNLIPIVVLTMLAAIPFINFIGEFNALILDTFFGKSNYFSSLRDNNELVTKKLLATDSYRILVYNIFIIGVLPGVFEELCFRGIIQNVFVKYLKNHHVAILLSALIFGFLHFEFYGIIPRTLMGIFFGYLLYWSGNLKLPMIAHFTNNDTIVILDFLIQRNKIDTEIETIGASSSTMLLGLLSGILFSVGVFYIYRNIQDKNGNQLSTQ
ncbi:MAG: CPBP family intramembrane metalloprotease [Bacteroidales bacterium]|nr:CPBP family intramembrane metalloprotease [Bacteroidales bacterium]